MTAALAVALVARVYASSAQDFSWCDAVAKIESGFVCGTRRRDSLGGFYASFRGVPYAKQPVGELRFRELLPAEPWEGCLNATTEGPICPQTDVFYGSMMQPHGMEEGCIHANIHVPIEALQAPLDLIAHGTNRGLPILVFIHGGGFMCGSGDSDLNGPEYLVTRGVIVITFNYRLNVFGFLSLNSTSIPGNNGLKDAITLLRWVQRNAAAFGGDPDAVTLAGHSAGAAMTHLLTLIPAAEGLFQKAITLSGMAFSNFFSSSPSYAKSAADMFLTKVGIDPQLDPEEIHRLLIEMPLETIVEANKYLLNLFGLVTFTPVVESTLPGVTAVLDADPEVLLDSGRGRHVPLLMGFTDAECETFRLRFEDIDIVSKIQTTPIITVPLRLIYRSSEEALPVFIKLINNRYFNNTVDIASFTNLCSDSFFVYPALKLARKRAARGAPTFLYRFSYESDHSPIKETLGLQYSGAGHVEDLTYILRVNSVLGPIVDNEFAINDKDTKMKQVMTDFVVNFMRWSHPMSRPNPKSHWPPTHLPLQYQSIAGPNQIQQTRPTADELDVIDFFDGLNKISQE